MILIKMVTMITQCRLDFPIPDSVSSDQKIEVGDLHAPKNFSFSILKYYKTRLSGLIEVWKHERLLEIQ